MTKKYSQPTSFISESTLNRTDMRVLLITVGSRGDTEPFCALSQELADAGYLVDFFVQKDSYHLVPSSESIIVHLLPFGTSDFYKFMNPSHGADADNPRVRFIGVVADVTGELVLPCWQQVLDVAKECDIIITSSLARSLSFALTQKLSVPSYLIHLQPLVPTALFPHYSNTDECVNCLTKSSTELTLEPKYLEGYWELERYLYDFLKQRVDNMYSEMALELNSTFEVIKEILSGNCSNISIINAFTNELVPNIPDAGPNVYNVGALADAYIPKNFEPPLQDSDLGLFLNQDTKPVCIGKK
jgi:hypothetical protein